MPKQYNENILKALKLSQDMISLADAGDSERKDRKCGIIYGIIRDSGYRIRELALAEIDNHRKKQDWDIDKTETESYLFRENK